MQRLSRLWHHFWRRAEQDAFTPLRARGPAVHVVVLDGTLSTLEPGYETNAGLTYKLLRSQRSGGQQTVYYEAGIQWRDWRSVWDVAAGRGINRQIRRAYGVLASRYRPGDRIILIGYSRGAYAVRSLAGVIDMVGLVRAEHATERLIQTAYRHYQAGADTETAARFWKEYCHPEVEIEAIGVWDTVKSLGLVMPVLWRLSRARHDFHNHHLGHSIRHGFQALALHETRVAYRPVLWTSRDDWQGRVEQLWFKGCHGDIGGELKGFSQARPLSNIALVWMLEKLQGFGLLLPDGWQADYPCDVRAPSVGNWRGWGKIFVSRARRKVGRDPSEAVHASVDPGNPLVAPLRDRGARVS